MLNLNSLKVIDVDVFTRLVLLCLFQLFNDLFFLALGCSPKASAKLLLLSLSTKFFNENFSKKFHFFCNLHILNELFLC